MKDDYIIAQNMLDKMRSSMRLTEVHKSVKHMINESKEDAVAITNDPKFGQNVLQSQENSFKEAVNSGAVFASENANDPTSSPLVFINKNDKINRPANMVFSGTIPGMNNLKFQFKLNESSGNGCFVWVEGMPLSEENMKTLNKLYGYYLNWKDQWNKDIDALVQMYNKSETDNE